MNNEAQPQELQHTGEHSPEIVTAYRQSVDMLFSLMAEHTGRGRATRYYNVQWDEQDPARIVDVTVMQAAATGAQRQAFGSTFLRAQFACTEMSVVTGARQRRIIWCGRAPASDKRPLTPDPAAMVAEHGYDVLAPAHIVNSLAGRAVTLDDYLHLTRTMRQRQALPTRELTFAVNRLLYRFAYGSLEQGNAASDSSHITDTLFELITSFQELDPVVLRGLQSYLVGQLMRRIGTLKGGEAVGDQGQTQPAVAAGILENALERGLLPREAYIVHRILGVSAVYRYRFATELLHERLYTGQDIGSTRRVYGIHRHNFMHDYMRNLLQARVRELDTPVTAFLDRGYPAWSIADEFAAQELYEFVNGLLCLVGDSDAPLQTVSMVSDVAPAFEYILSRLTNPGADSPGRAEFDRKAVEIIDIVTIPIVQGWVGRRAVARQVEAEPQSE